jgi:hypothetical protein
VLRRKGSLTAAAQAAYGASPAFGQTLAGAPDPFGAPQSSPELGVVFQKSSGAAGGEPDRSAEGVLGGMAQAEDRAGNAEERSAFGPATTETAETFGGFPAENAPDTAVAGAGTQAGDPTTQVAGLISPEGFQNFPITEGPRGFVDPRSEGVFAPDTTLDWNELPPANVESGPPSSQNWEEASRGDGGG